MYGASDGDGAGDSGRVKSSNIYVSCLTKGLYGDGGLVTCHHRVSYLIINFRVPVKVMLPVTVVG